MLRKKKKKYEKGNYLELISPPHNLPSTLLEGVGKGYFGLQGFTISYHLTTHQVS